MLSSLRARCPRIQSKIKLQSRALTVASLDPSIQGLTSALARTQPCFSAQAERVHVLREPNEFYDTLLGMIRRARRRIFLSSLYIGEDEHELVRTLHEALTRTPTLKLHIALDFNRSTRPSTSSPNTASLLAPLVQTHGPERVRICLFRSPRLKPPLSWVIPRRFDEGWGTWHAKVYGVDDDVMISGANLNKSYFTARQDRYVLFTQNPALAGYTLAFLHTAARFSYRLLPPSASISAPSPDSASSANYTLHWPLADTPPHNIEPAAASLLESFQSSARIASAFALRPRPQALSHPYSPSKYYSLPSSPEEGIVSEADDSAGDDVLLFPVLQAGQFGIREEEGVVAALFEHLSDSDSKNGPPFLHLTSGYFALPPQYQSLLVGSSVPASVLCASPQANGFYGSKGVSGRIPEGYTLLERQFVDALESVGRHKQGVSAPGDAEGVELKEWNKDGWTYHAKGLWASPSPSEDPVLTLLGSTNLSSRSTELDLELSLLMLTSSPILRKRLREEREALWAHAVPWRGANGGERKVRLGTRALMWGVKDML